jgi:hypothetical protein
VGELWIARPDGYRLQKVPVRASENRPNCGFYLRQEHRLIRRHEESLLLNVDNTASWTLRIDLELPDHAEAGLPLENGERDFLFPLVYLRKNESRMQFKVYEEGGKLIPLPIRRECDEISAGAVAEAINFHGRRGSSPLHFDSADLKDSILKITKSKAYESSMALQVLRREFGIDSTDQGSHQKETAVEELGQAMVSSGLDQGLELMVEHALIWVNLRGRPNERRSIFLTQEIALRRRSLVRWSFGRLGPPPKPWRQRRWARIAKEGGSTTERAVLIVAGKPYGRRDRRFSGSALGERIGQPLGWMPFEFDLPTIYAKRCSSYHFEVRCPPGRSPRALKVTGGALIDESETPKPRQRIKESRLALTSRNARFDVPRGGLDEVARFHVTVGIGNGAFPLLWFLAGAITTAMLWILASSNPSLVGEHARTTAGILLIVPALIAGLAAASSEVPVSQLIGGARILLLTTGLFAVLAAAVLAGARPFDMSSDAVWSLCAIGATVSTAPLATSWLLSIPAVWRQMVKLNTYPAQKVALAVGVVFATFIDGALSALGSTDWVRVALAALLLASMFALSTLANNRAGMKVDEGRRYLGLAFLITGLTCLALACFEVRCLLSERAIASAQACFGPTEDLTSLRRGAELAALALLAISYGIGDLLSAVAARAKHREDEVHISPRNAKALLSQESVRELPELFERERDAKKRPAISSRSGRRRV